MKEKVKEYAEKIIKFLEKCRIWIGNHPIFRKSMLYVCCFFAGFLSGALLHNARSTELSGGSIQQAINAVDSAIRDNQAAERDSEAAERNIEQLESTITDGREILEEIKSQKLDSDDRN